MLEYMIDNTVDSTIRIVTRHCTADFKCIGKHIIENAVNVYEKALSDFMEQRVGQFKIHHM